MHVCALADAHVYKDNAKVGLFIAAAMGTITLMAAVYCIYNKFYTKQQYLHTQLHDDQGAVSTCNASEFSGFPGLNCPEEMFHC